MLYSIYKSTYKAALIVEFEKCQRHMKRPEKSADALTLFSIPIGF